MYPEVLGRLINSSKAQAGRTRKDFDMKTSDMRVMWSLSVDGDFQRPHMTPVAVSLQSWTRDLR